MSLEIVSPHDGHRQHGLCVLLIEPDAAMRHFVARVLERHGLDALQVETLEEAVLVRLHQEHPVVAVICDDAGRHGDDRHAMERLSTIVPSVPLITYGFGSQDDRRGVPHPFDGDAFADRLWRAIRAVRASRSGSSGGEQRPDIAPGNSGRDHSFDQRDHA
jgi:CheY-like chemotaxis protein